MRFQAAPGAPRRSQAFQAPRALLGASQRLPSAPRSVQSVPYVFLRVAGPQSGGAALGCHGDPLWLPADASQRCPVSRRRRR
eukprot:747826-Pyramimonas_sp.AAC.1